MNYTKRDLELLIILSENLNKYMSGIGGSFGLCGCLCDILREPGVFEDEIDRLSGLIENEFTLINPNYKSGYGMYMWEKRAIFPRQKFLDDLIEKIKNSLSN